MIACGALRGKAPLPQSMRLSLCIETTVGSRPRRGSKFRARLRARAMSVFEQVIFAAERRRELMAAVRLRARARETSVFEQAVLAAKRRKDLSLGSSEAKAPGWFDRMTRRGAVQQWCLGTTYVREHQEPHWCAAIQGGNLRLPEFCPRKERLVLLWAVSDCAHEHDRMVFPNVAPLRGAVTGRLILGPSLARLRRSALGPRLP